MSIRPEVPQRPESPDAQAAAEFNPYFHATGYYREGIQRRTQEQVVADAQAVLTRVRQVRRTNQPPRGQRSLMELWSYAGRPEPAEPEMDENEPLRPVPQTAQQPRLPVHQSPIHQPPVHQPPVHQQPVQQVQPVPQPVQQQPPRAIYTAAVPGAPAGALPAGQVQRLPSAPNGAPSVARLPGESAFGPPQPRTTANGGTSPVDRLPLLR